MKTFEWINILNSPFVRPRVNIYIGKVAVGTPYFFPRRLVKPNAKQADELAAEKIADAERFNERNAKNDYRRRVPTFEEARAEVMRGRIFVPRRIGFDFVGLGYKTKWSDTDYRFEWSPCWSFVFFKWQIALTFTGPRGEAASFDSYWTSWLYYTNNTEGTIEERVAQCKKDYPQTYTVSNGETRSTVNYYDIVLKKKYR
jgi:hypothetical protein